MLFELGPGEPRELLRWEDHAPVSSVAADLDGDGLREIYLGTGTYTRKLIDSRPTSKVCGAAGPRTSPPIG